MTEEPRFQNCIGLSVWDLTAKPEKKMKLPLISTEAARRLFLDAQGLLAKPTGKATRATLANLIGAERVEQNWKGFFHEATRRGTKKKLDRIDKIDFVLKPSC